MEASSVMKMRSFLCNKHVKLDLWMTTTSKEEHLCGVIFAYSVYHGLQKAPIEKYSKEWA